MADNANNLWLGPVYNLKTLLSTLDAFQTFCGIDPASPGAEDAALARIYFPGVGATPATVRTARPFAILFLGPTFDAVRSSTGHFATSGSIGLLLEKDVASAYAAKFDAASMAAAEAAFANAVGDVLAELLIAGCQEGNLAVNAVRLAAGPSRPDDPKLPTADDPDAEGDYYQATFAVEWGL